MVAAADALIDTAGALTFASHRHVPRSRAIDLSPCLRCGEQPDHGEDGGKNLTHQKKLPVVSSTVIVRNRLGFVDENSLFSNNRKGQKRNVTATSSLSLFKTF